MSLNYLLFTKQDANEQAVTADSNSKNKLLAVLIGLSSKPGE